MTLNSADLKALSAAQEEPIPAEEFRHIQKKSGERAIRILFTALSMLLVIASVGSFLADREFPLFYILVLAFLALPMSVDSYRNRKKNPCACYEKRMVNRGFFEPGPVPEDQSFFFISFRAASRRESCRDFCTLRSKEGISLRMTRWAVTFGLFLRH